MTKGETARLCRQMSTEDQAAFDRWLKRSAIVGSIFAAAVFIMAISAANIPGPREAAAQGAGVADAAATSAEESRVLSPYELMIRLKPDELPVQQVDEPF